MAVVHGRFASLCLLGLVACAPPVVERPPDPVVNTERRDGGAGSTGGTGGRNQETEPDTARPMDTRPAGGEEKPDMRRPPRDAGRDRAPPPADLPPEAPRVRRALLVVASPNDLSMGDQRIRDALEDKGVMVTLGNDQGPGSQANGMDLVVVTSSGASEDIAGKYRTVTVPVLCFETGILDDMGMTGPGLEMNFGVSESTQIEIVAALHPLAAGLSGTVNVASESGFMTWGIPAATATKVATLTGADANKSTIFFYERGAMMVGLEAPALRVGHFAGDTVIENLTANGQRLLDAAIDFVLR